MRRTYRALAALAVVAMLAALFYASFTLGLTFSALAIMLGSAYASLTYRLAILFLASVSSLLIAATLALAVVVAAWTGRKGWLATLAIVSALAIYWQVIVLCADVYFPFVINRVVSLVYPVGELLLFSLAPLCAALLALVFAIRGAVSGSEDGTLAAGRARDAYTALAIGAAVAIVAIPLAPYITQALQTGYLAQFVAGSQADLARVVELGRLLAQAVEVTRGALTVGVVVAAVALAAWARSRGWLVALAVVGALGFLAPILMVYPLIYAVRIPEPAPLGAYGPFTIQTVIGLVPCALALVYAFVGLRRAAAVVAAA